MKRAEAGRRSGPGAWRRRGVRIVLILTGIALAAGVYAAAALIAVPLVVGRALADFAALAPGREVTFERVRVNPFTLAMDLRGLEIADRRTRTTATLASLYADFSIDALLERRWVLDALELERPALRLDGTGEDTESVEAARAAAIGALRGLAGSIRVERFRLADGSLTLGARDGAAAGLVLGGWRATATGVDAARNLGDYEGEIRAAFGGTLHFAGKLALGDFVARGELGGEGLDLSRLGPWLEPELAALPPAGALDLTGEYELSTRPRLTLRGRIAPGGARVDVEAGRDDGRESLQVRLEDVPAPMVSKYAASALGRGLAAGRIELGLDYSQAAGHRAGEFSLRALDLAFEPVRDGRDPARNLPLELAAALLEDPNRELALAVPFSMSADAATVAAPRGMLAAAAAALRARVAALGGDPFGVLGGLVGVDGRAFEAIRFEPGTAALSDAALATLDGLAAALAERPGIGVAVSGGFDSKSDRDALARQQIELHVLLATAEAAPQARPAELDLTSPRVQDVLDEFATERLTSARLAALAAQFEHDPSAPSDDPSRVAYYRAVFDGLVANETIEPGVLARLGRFRARSIVDALAMRSIASERLEIVRNDLAIERDANGIAVPLAIEALD